MSADKRTLEAKRLSQPLEAAPMPEFEFQRSSDREQDFQARETGDNQSDKLDLSEVVLNLS